MMEKWPVEKLFLDGDSYFAAALEKIRQAKNYIQLESYIFDVDEIGQIFINTLGEAVSRGVQVHIIVDGIGSVNSLTQLKVQCGEKGFHLRVYHPIPFIEGGLKRFSLRGLKIIFGLFGNLNKRNHRKVITIDGESAFVGSINISRVHSKKIMGDKAWNDTGAYVEGSAVKDLSRAFAKAWLQYRLRLFSGERSIQRAEDKLIRLNSKMMWRYSLLHDLIRRIVNAQKEILITNAYFVPKRRILKALCRAASNGVAVGICIPAKSDAWIVQSAAKNLYYQLLKAGVKIFEYQTSMLHAKTMIIDQWATVGSHNLNHRSFMHDLEADVVLTHPENIRALKEKWETDVTQSRDIQISDLGKLNLWQRFVAKVAYWFKYWI